MARVAFPQDVAFENIVEHPNRMSAQKQIKHWFFHILPILDIKKSQGYRDLMQMMIKNQSFRLLFDEEKKEWVDLMEIMTKIIFKTVKNHENDEKGNPSQQPWWNFTIWVIFCVLLRFSEIWNIFHSIVW